MKINWFSPLPPAQSGIAQNFAMQLLPALVERHELVLWTDQSHVTPEVERLARIARYDPENPPLFETNDTSISLYHLGNHAELHAGAWQASLRRPGIVVLHDLCFHDFFFEYWVQRKKEPASYLAVLERWYGMDGRRAGEAFCQGGISAESMADNFPLTREAARGALGVITHAEPWVGHPQERPACAMTAIHHPYRAAPSSKHAAWLAARSATPHPPYRLVMFGHLNRNRRLEAVLAALAGMEERERFRLEVYGALWDEGRLRRLIEELHLQPLVKIAGFLPEDLVEDTLATADLAINLRYPSMGEVSGSQLQFWDYGLPTLVTRTGWYTYIPEGAAAFVRPDHEIEDLQAHLRALTTTPASFREMGEFGRHLLENYDPVKYVDALERFVASLFRPVNEGLPLGLASRIGADMRGWLHPGSSDYLLDRASREIAAIWPDSGEAAK